MNSCCDSVYADKTELNWAELVLEDLNSAQSKSRIQVWFKKWIN